MADLPPVVGPYQLHERQASDRYGVMYRATTAEGATVALFLFQADYLALNNPGAAEQFERALAPLRAVDGENLVRVLDSGVAGGRFFLVQDYYDWPALATLLAEQRRADLTMVLRVGRGVAAALDQLHRAGLDHGDIRPENILMGPNYQVRLTGLGVAHVVRYLANDEAERLQFARYISPEKAAGSAEDIRSDLYALGVVLYEAIAGEPPFQGSSLFATARQHILAPAPPLTRFRPQVPANLVRLVEQLLAKQPERRFQTPAELLAALHALSPLEAVEPLVPRRETKAISRLELLQARQAALASAQQVAAETTPATRPATTAAGPKLSPALAQVQVPRPTPDRPPAGNHQRLLILGLGGALALVIVGLILAVLILVGRT